MQPTQTNNDNDFVLRLPDVMRITGLSRTTLYSLISEGLFPKQFKLGGRSSGWSNNEVQTWLQERANERMEARA